MCIQAYAIRFGKPVNKGARFVYNSSFVFHEDREDRFIPCFMPCH